MHGYEKVKSSQTFKFPQKIEKNFVAGNYRTLYHNIDPQKAINKQQNM